MSGNKYPNSGAMFAREKRNERAADFSGQFTIDDDVLDYVIRKAEQGEPVELDISGWKKRTTSSGTMLGLQIRLPYRDRQNSDRPRENNARQQPARGTYRSGGNFRDRGNDAPRQGRFRQEDRPRQQDFNDPFPEDFGEKDPFD